MKRFQRPQLIAALLASSLYATSAGTAPGNALTKVMEMMASLRAKIHEEGAVEAKTSKETAVWCRDTELSTKNNIKLATAAVAKAKATIAEASADIEESSSKIDELAASIASDTSKLKKASSMRQREAADFKAAEMELLETVDSIGKALSVIGTEMKKNPASLAQVDTSTLNSLLQTFSTVMDAAALPSVDKQKLMALIQDEQGDDLKDDDSAAPAYKSQSGSIFEMLEDMRLKAESQLNDLRKAESSAEQSYRLLKMSVETEIAESKKSLNAAKSAKAGAMQAKGAAEGDLTKAEAALSENTKVLEDMLHDCATAKEDYEAFKQSQAEELAALDTAEKAIKDAMGAVGSAADIQVSAGSVSLLQLQGHANVAKVKVLAIVKSLARKHHSLALAQLASRMKVLLRYSSRTNADPFNKVRGLITDMISKLEDQLGKEASEKAFCDKEMAKTKAALEDLNSDLTALDAKLETSRARAVRFSDSKKETESEMAANAKEKAEKQAIFAEEKENYKVVTADLKAGLAGVRAAIKVLREYYGGAAFVQQSASSSLHAPNTAAGQGILDMLEVIEDDLAKSLGAEERIYEDAKTSYEKEMQDFAVTRASNEKDAKYYGQKFLSQRQTTSELEEEQEGKETERESVVEYYDKLKERCVAKPGSYAAEKKRREQEIAGLKQALAILESETSFLQQGRHSFRGRRSLRDFRPDAA